MKQLWPGIKILGYTFNSGETEQMLESGADACLLKCRDPQEFKNKPWELYPLKNT